MLKSTLVVLPVEVSLPPEAIMLAAPGESAAPGTAKTSPQKARWWAILLVAWVLGGLYGGTHLMRGWVPHDDGAFAQSADRVLHGEVPHRDYIEIYTGGLAYLNALAFRCLGENLAALRIVLFTFFLAWIPTFYWIASRMVTDWVAGGLTLLAVAWSLPNYSAAVPSWYNLFFATFGLAALFRYLETRATKWVFIAGFCGGLSLLVKIAGAYYITAACLFFYFWSKKSPAHYQRKGSPGAICIGRSSWAQSCSSLAP